MPGLVGFVGNSAGLEPERFLADMARALKHEDWYQTDLYYGEQLGLGRVSLGIINPDPQPIWNEDRSLCIVMEGELYDSQGLKQALIDRDYDFRINNDAELVLHLYEKYGEDFAVKLNGAFLVAIWDQRRQKLTIVNDRLGLQPLYFTQRNGFLTFASGMGAMLADPALPRAVDRVGIAQFLMFDHMLGHRTLLEAVRLLEPASCLTFCDGRLTIRPYWTMRFPEHYQLRPEEAFLEELTYYLRQAITRQAPGNLPAGVLLSGGLDSRVILAGLRDAPFNGPLHTFTFGIPGCDDARFARELSDRVGTQHHFFELKPDYLLDLAEKGIRITDGLQNCVHMHALATLPAQAEYAQLFYKGFMGDAMMGYAQKRELWARYQGDTQYQVDFQIVAGFNTHMVNEAEQKLLFTDEFLSHINGTVCDTYREALSEAQTDELADRRVFFDLRQRVPRMTLKGVELVRSRGVVRLPFCDNDLLDFTLSLPPGFRLERYLIKEAFIRAFPELAKVPYTETNFPMVPCLRDSLMRLDRQLRWRLRAAGLGWVPVKRRRRYADYNDWFRTVLRSWVEETLVSERSLDRGFFRPNYVRKLVADHMAGADHAGKLGALLTLELWHNQFID